MKKILAFLFLFIFSLMACDQKKPIDVGAITIDPSEKKYVEIRQI